MARPVEAPLILHPLSDSPKGLVFKRPVTGARPVEAPSFCLRFPIPRRGEPCDAPSFCLRTAYQPGGAAQGLPLRKLDPIPAPKAEGSESRLSEFVARRVRSSRCARCCKGRPEKAQELGLRVTAPLARRVGSQLLADLHGYSHLLAQSLKQID